MRQVPVYLILGSGRVATHFCHYFSLLGLSFEHWSRQTHSSEDLSKKAANASHILFLVKDSAISTLADSLVKKADQTWIHFSGQLSLPKMYGAHPLMTFTHELQELSFYTSIPFIVECHSPPFLTLLPGLPNPFHLIALHHKNFYHALCVLSGNFTCILWQKFFKELEETFQLPASVAFPYLQQICVNLMTNPKMALTGPLMRNDLSTIAANVEALKEDPFLSVYQSFLQIFAKKAASGG